MQKIIIIYGPTAIGKTSLALKLAKKLNGELISGDSRQIYKEMDIVTGKDKDTVGEIPIWGLDLVKPNEEFTVAHWLKYLQKILKYLRNKHKLAIIVGGTGFWVKSLLDGISSIGVEPNWNLRQELSNVSVEKLRERLTELNPEKLAKMNTSDRNNPRRLIRAIEIANASKKIIKQKKIKADILFLGLTASKETIFSNIDLRIKERISLGAENEIAQLIASGHDWNLPSMSAIGYREWREYFNGQSSKEKTIDNWRKAEYRLVKRQLLWFKNDNRISWINIEQTSYREIEKLALNWYNDFNAA